MNFPPVFVERNIKKKKDTSDLLESLEHPTSL